MAGGTSRIGLAPKVGPQTHMGDRQMIASVVSTMVRVALLQADVACAVDNNSSHEGSLPSQ